MRIGRVIQVLFVAFGLAIGGVAGTVGSHGVFTRTRALKEPTPRLLAICIDALQVDTFENLLDEGKLPNISRLLRRLPSIRGRALASFPSSTAPSVTEFLTGMYADRTPGMPRAIHAFDRPTSTARRYTLEPRAWTDGTPTLFSLLDSRGETSFCLFEGEFEGSESILSRKQILVAGALELLHLPVYNPDRPLLERFRRLIATRGAPPRAAFLMLSSVDLAGHVRGPRSRRSIDALTDLDRLLGRLFDWMATYQLPEGGSYLDATTVVIFGDHGMESTGRFSDLEPTLRRQGLRVVDLGTVVQVALREKLSSRWAQRPDALLAPGGSNVTQIYLRQGDGTWGTGPAGPETAAPLVEALERVAGVEFVARPVGCRSLELRRAGRRTALLVMDGEGSRRRFAYGVASGPGLDPLGYLADREAAGLVHVVDSETLDQDLPSSAFHPFNTWHAATHATDYPAAVPLLLKGCAPGPTQGDLVLTTERGWSFLRHGSGDHGGLRRGSIETPLVLAGRNVDSQGSLDGARLIDLLPTFLDLLGLEADPAYLDSLDGHALRITRRDLPRRGYIPLAQVKSLRPPATSPASRSRPTRH